MRFTDDERYAQATREVLEKSKMSASAVALLGARSQPLTKHDVLGTVGEADFSWPWFDEWLDTFSAERKWPSAPAWSWFEAPPDELRTVREVVGQMTVSALKAAAAKRNIDLGDAKLVDDLRKLLARKLKWADVEEAAAAMNQKRLAVLAKKQLDAKCQLLAMSINSRAHHIFRHAQICELLDAPTIRKYKVKIEADDNAFSRRLAKEWIFNPKRNSNLPPFFPGDRSSIETH